METPPISVSPGACSAPGHLQTFNRVKSPNSVCTIRQPLRFRSSGTIRRPR